MSGCYGQKLRADAIDRTTDIWRVAADGDREGLPRRSRQDGDPGGRYRLLSLESDTAFPDRQKTGERKMGIEA